MSGYLWAAAPHPATPVVTPKVIFKDIAYEALPTPEDHMTCTGCAGFAVRAAPGLCRSLPCFPDDSPLGVFTIYKKVAQ